MNSQNLQNLKMQVFCQKKSLMLKKRNFLDCKVKSSYQDWQLNKQTHWFSAEMPIVSGFVVPKINPTSHVGNIKLLRPVVVNIERKEDNQAENDHTKDAEEPKEILHLRSS